MCCMWEMKNSFYYPGYPEHVVFSDFRRRFDVLLRHLSSKLPSNSTSVSLMEDKEATENILKEVELNRSQFRIGASQVRKWK